MIVFTGSGAIASAFEKQFQCKILSFRSLSQNEIDQAIGEATVVIHNAANLKPVSLDEAMKDNFLLTKTIIDSILRVKPTLPLLYISTMSLLEDDDTYLQPDAMTIYARSKFFGEQYVLNQHSPEFRSIRFSTIFYEDPMKDGLSKLICNGVLEKAITLINHGVAKRDFVPLKIAVRYLYQIAMSPAKSRIINVGSGESISFNEAAIIVADVVPDLRITNKTIEDGPIVLADFSLDALREYGLIKFDIRESIRDYANSLTI